MSMTAIAELTPAHQDVRAGGEHGRWHSQTVKRLVARLATKVTAVPWFWNSVTGAPMFLFGSLANLMHDAY
jgi:hypothetical protein